MSQKEYNAADIDLLATVEQGGCSAKIPASQLAGLLQNIPLPVDANVLVDVASHDDAGVYRISDDMALIFTTDFFPPVCSSPVEFGRIAAANSLSDVYAMGGQPLLTLNLCMFPSTKLPLEALRDMLAGGQEKINESGAMTMGGHTIEDYPPKYGLAVVGTVHPSQLVTNAGARAGDVLILTKPLGTGVVIAAHRLGMDDPESYAAAIAGMKQLNDKGAAAMRRHGIAAATDITGFGLAGHLLGLCRASDVSACIDACAVPLLPGVVTLLDEGCVPGTAFKNMEYAGLHADIDPSLPLTRKMAMFDAQTSGGLLICTPPQKVAAVLAELQEHYPYTAVVGRIVPRAEKYLYIA